MPRAFVAVVPPIEIRRELIEATMPLRDSLAGARWADASQLHLTLAFLGDHADLDEAERVLRVLNFGSFDLSLRGLGAFARPSAARVLWAGICKGRHELVNLADALDQGLERERDEVFRPHVTLARFRAATDLRHVVSLQGVERTWTVHELVLFESVRDANGARHREHVRVPARSTT